MKKILTILLLFISLTGRGATYYVSLTGNDANPGTYDQPWASLARASGEPSLVSGDIIHIRAGSYIEDHICDIPVGVTLRGDGIDITILHMRYKAGIRGASIRLSSSSRTAGNQTISYMTLDGDGLTGTRAILVRFRSNVMIHNVKIVDFEVNGVYFNNETYWLSEPTTYTTGNSIHHCTINNCSDRQFSDDGGCLRVDGQEGFRMYDNFFDQTQRTAGHNGNIYNLSNDKDIKIYNNTFRKNDEEGTEWNFFCEIFEIKGALEIYNNTHYGGAVLDLGGYDVTAIKGSYEYSTSIHDNTFTPNNTLYVNQIYHHAIEIENGAEYVYVYNNYIKNYQIGISFVTNDRANQTQENIWIYNNRIECVETSNAAYANIGIWITGPSTTYSNIRRNIYISNNTITASNTYTTRNGIRWNANGTVDNVVITNNIIVGFSSHAISFVRQTSTVDESASIDGLYVHHNIFYDNNTDGVDIDPTISVTDSTLYPNYRSDPGLISTTDFHLIPGAFAIGAGTTTLSAYDADGNFWYNPPSIGAYEYLRGIVKPTITTNVVYNISNTSATSGGYVLSDGGGTITARGVCWSTNPSPTLLNNYTVNGSGIGVFTSYMTGLSTATTYYIRAYATNSAGTIYGNERSFVTDPGGQELNGKMLKLNGKLVRIGGNVIEIQ